MHRHIVSEQQKELASLAQANKVLESENRLLLSETEQLREEMRALEESVERSIAREEAALASPALSDDNNALAQQVKDMRVRHEVTHSPFLFLFLSPIPFRLIFLFIYYIAGRARRPA